jgi:predicted site-specific integrase-resolvase
VQNEQFNSSSARAVIALNRWLEQVGVTPVTAWRWRQRGWLKTVNIAGRQYLTQEAIDEFHRRAVAGEFVQVHKVPSRNGNSQRPEGGV